MGEATKFTSGRSPSMGEAKRSAVTGSVLLALLSHHVLLWRFLRFVRGRDESNKQNKQKSKKKKNEGTPLYPPLAPAYAADPRISNVLANRVCFDENVHTEL